MYADPTLMDLAAAYAKRRNARKTKHAVACARPGAKAKFNFSEINMMLNMLASQTVDQQDLARKNAKAVAEFVYQHGTNEQIKRFVALANKVGLHETMSRPGTKAKMDRRISVAEGEFVTALSSNTRVPIDGGNGWVTVDPGRYITAKRVRVPGVKGEVEVHSVVDGNRIVGVTAKRISASRPGAKAKMGRAEDIYRKLSSGSVTLANAKEMERLAVEALRLPDFTPAGTDWSLHELAEEIGAEVLALKSRASRPGAKAKMGLLDRLGAAASALAGPGKDPTTQEYKTSVAEAKKAAIDEVKNYAFMVKQNDQKLAALDAYVKSTSKAIATLNSAPEILRLTDGLRQAVKARSVLLQTLKMPFGRDGAKVKNASQSRELTTGFKKQIASALRESEKLQDKVQDFVFALDKKQRDAARSKLKAKADQLKAVLAEAKSLLSDVEDVAFDMSGLGMELGQSFEDLQADAIKAQEGLRKLPAFQAKLESVKRSATDAGRTTSARHGKGHPGAKAKSTHAALPPQTLEAERKPGGGSHSEAVSRKIATLINEGKPQDQAVAIALDLERRGEL